MKVRMKIHTGRANKKLCPGDVIKVDDLTGHRWIDEGFAEFVVEPPAPKKEPISKNKEKEPSPKNKEPAKKSESKLDK